MSHQPPLVPPTTPSPSTPRPPSPSGFEPYAAPAYGDRAGEPPAGMPASGPGQAYQVAPQYVVNPAAPVHLLAITSLVLGLVGIVSVLLALFLYVTILGGVCSPLATWLGFRARREIQRNPGAYGGEGLAVAGLVTGLVGTVLAVLALVLILVLVVFLAALFGSFSR